MKTEYAQVIEKDATASKFIIKYETEYILFNLIQKCAIFNKSIKRNRDGMYVKDLSGKNNDGELILGKGKITKANVEEIPNTIVPDRRYGTMECMYHEDEGIVNQKFAGDPKATAKNEVIYKKKMQKNQIDIDTDEYGLREMKYQIDSTDTIYNRHKLINVRF